jgi:hypothetical protein
LGAASPSDVDRLAVDYHNVFRVVGARVELEPFPDGPVGSLARESDQGAIGVSQSCDTSSWEMDRDIVLDALPATYRLVGLGDRSSQ